MFSSIASLLPSPNLSTPLYQTHASSLRVVFCPRFFASWTFCLLHFLVGQPIYPTLTLTSSASLMNPENPLSLLILLTIPSPSVIFSYLVYYGSTLCYFCPTLHEFPTDCRTWRQIFTQHELLEHPSPLLKLILSIYSKSRGSILYYIGDQSFKRQTHLL